MQTRAKQHPADVILRSSDGQSFHSWKALLSISSPLFSDMFALPQPDTPDNVDDGRPVIDLPEDSRTLGYILSLCHPARGQFKVESIRDFGTVLEAVTKYDMESIRSAMLEELTNPSLLREDPVKVYAIACQYECREPARLAAKHCLALPALGYQYVPELEKIHADKLWRLLMYREACITAASSLADNHTWVVYTHPSALFGCRDDENEGMGWTTVRSPPSRKYRHGRVVNMSVHTWWLEYMRKSGSALQRSPQGDAVKDQQLVGDVLLSISSSRCKSCNLFEVRETFLSFVDSFAKEVEHHVAEVEIDVGF